MVMIVNEIDGILRVLFEGMNKCGDFEISVEMFVCIVLVWFINWKFEGVSIVSSYWIEIKDNWR